MKIKTFFLLTIAFFCPCIGFLVLRDNRLYFFLPQAKKTGLVTDIKDIHIKNMPSFINGSIEHYKDHYLMAFRINDPVPELSKIGLVELDTHFQQIGTTHILDIDSKYAEDPRLIFYNDHYYVIYNDVFPIKDFCRAMKIAPINIDNWQAPFSTFLDQHIQPIEKNWVPFIYDNIHLMFAYSLVPHKIMELKNIRKNSLKHLIFDHNPCMRRFHWKWGLPRGGTPAKLVDGEYLAFFHSSRKCHLGGRKYVMGAYTFSATPPFKVTRVSQFPIICYPQFTTKIIFPAGFVEDIKEGKEVFHISCGFEDKITKIVTVDKEKLYKSLKKL